MRTAATTVICTLSLHDALPIYHEVDATAEQRRYLDLLILQAEVAGAGLDPEAQQRLKLINQQLAAQERDRKSTRLNSSHVAISYAVFCLIKKNVIMGARANRED